MEQYYYLITIVLYGVFIVRFILSWIGADFDMDADADIDLSDVVSFKGLTHFLMGFFSWLSLTKYISHEINPLDYLMAICCGIIFIGVLFLVYKFMMKLESKPEIKSGKELIGTKGTIYLVYDNHYVVTIANGNGTVEVSGKSNKKLNIGDTVIISDYVNGYYILN